MPRCVNKWVLLLFLSISCCFCVFACKPKEPERKKISSIDKPLNLSLLFHNETWGPYVSYDTIDGNVIRTLRYPYSIDIADDSIIVTRRKRSSNKEYRNKLTDEQHLKIKNLVSNLYQEYEISSEERIGPLDGGWLCILKIDNQVHYKHGACENNPEFTHPAFDPMPREVLLLFRYITDLSPIKIRMR